MQLDPIHRHMLLFEVDNVGNPRRTMHPFHVINLCLYVWRPWPSPWVRLFTRINSLDSEVNEYLAIDSDGYCHSASTKRTPHRRLVLNKMEMVPYGLLGE